MRVSINWLKELVNLNLSIEELVKLIPIRTIGTKEITSEYIELDMKGYNRADLLSMRGVALEVSAITDSQIKFTETSEDEYIWVGQDLPKTNTKVEDNNLCPLYCIAKIENLRVGPSDKQWIKKLEESGMRSVNNMADATNLFMLEYGQPLHAFDADKVEDPTLIVRTAKEGEKLATLDGKIRNLNKNDLLIADPQKPLGLAGVMGGKDSEVSDSTTTILLEAAIFNHVNIRQTASRHNLPSEASKRFQHGLTKKRLLQALDATIRMYQNLGGKLTAISIMGDTTDPTIKIQLSPQKINSLIGVEIDPKQVEEYLTKLHFQFRNTDGEWEVTSPYFRLDIKIEEDLVEEVARMYGYEKIPAKALVGKLPEKIDQTLFTKIYSIKNSLVDLGLTEVQTYSFYSTDVLNNLNINKEQLIKIANPISSETEYLKDNLWPNLLETAAKNIRNSVEAIAIFEIGKVYIPQIEEPPKEVYKLALALSSDSTSPILELKQILCDVIKNLDKDLSITFNMDSDPKNQLFHPVRLYNMKINSQNAGFIAEVHPKVTHKFKVDKRVAVLEINIESILD